MRLLRFSLLVPALVLCIGCTVERHSEPATEDTTSVIAAPAPDEPPPSEGGEETAGEDDSVVVGDDPCTTDADCVPAGCCHASACVATTHRPDCTDVMCTADCQFGTLDCGGACLCIEGRCAARLSQPPAGLRDIQ